MSMGGGPGGGGGNEVFEPNDPGVKLDVDDEGPGPYLLPPWMSSGIEWRKFLIGGLLVLRPAVRPEPL